MKLSASIGTIGFLKIGIFVSFFLPVVLSSFFYLLSLIIFIAIFLISIKTKRSSISLARPRSHIPILMLCFVIFLSYFFKWTIFGFNDHDNLNISNFNSALSLSIYAIAALISLFGTFLIVSNTDFNKNQVVDILFFTAKCGFFSALITIVFWALQTGATFGRYNYTPLISGSQGIQLYQMIISFFCILVLLISNAKNKVLLVTLSSLIIFCMTTIIVRETWLIFFLTLAIAYLKLSQRSFFIKSSVFFLGITIISIIIFSVSANLNLTSDIISADGSELGESVLIRFIMLQESFNLFLDNIFLGIGYGNYVSVIQHTIVLESGAERIVSSPHNGLAMVLTENGIFGFIAMILLGFYLYNDMNIKRKINSQLLRSVSVIFSSFFLLLFLDQLVSNSLILPPSNEINVVQLSYLIWILFAVTVSSKRSLLKETKIQKSGL